MQLSSTDCWVEIWVCRVVFIGGLGQHYRAPRDRDNADYIMDLDELKYYLYLLKNSPVVGMSHCHPDDRRVF